MTRIRREFRLLPFVLVAIVSLLALKVLGLSLDGGYTLNDLNTDVADGAVPANDSPQTVVSSEAGRPKGSWAQEMFGFPDVAVTGSVGASKPAEAKDGGKPEPAKPGKTAEAPPINGTLVPLNAGPQPPPGERAILERLGERRQELEARAREIEIRESLLKAAEKQLENKIGELKALESRVSTASGKKDDAEAQRFKGLVTMYENMKAKDAARIFDRLEMRVLIEVALQINPRRMSDIMGQMTGEAAEKLTVEMANRAGSVEKAPLGDLPKIEGRPRP